MTLLLRYGKTLWSCWKLPQIISANASPETGYASWCPANADRTLGRSETRAASPNPLRPAVPLMGSWLGAFSGCDLAESGRSERRPSKEGHRRAQWRASVWRSQLEPEDERDSNVAELATVHTLMLRGPGLEPIITLRGYLLAKRNTDSLTPEYSQCYLPQYLHNVANGVISKSFRQPHRSQLALEDRKFRIEHPFLELGLYYAQAKRYEARNYVAKC
jgi:hypothetical protein